MDAKDVGRPYDSALHALGIHVRGVVPPCFRWTQPMPALTVHGSSHSFERTVEGEWPTCRRPAECGWPQFVCWHWLSHSLMTELAGKARERRAMICTAMPCRRAPSCGWAPCACGMIT